MDGIDVVGRTSYIGSARAVTYKKTIMPAVANELRLINLQY